MRKQRPKRMARVLLVAALLVAMAPASMPVRGGQGPLSKPTLAVGPGEVLSAHADELSVQNIIARMVEANRLRDAALQRYTATRDYLAIGLRLNQKAAMQAQVRFESPSIKRFTILSEEGSDAIRKRVFRGMMNDEVESMEPEMRRRNAINTDNYNFKLTGEDAISGRDCYVLNVVPKRKDKHLFQGRIWIAAGDFAIIKMRGAPAKMPSFWTRKVEFERNFQKIHDFWLPAKDEAEIQLLVFGKSRVVVEHSNYQLEVANGSGVGIALENAVSE